jgi:hypothetical protein
MAKKAGLKGQQKKTEPQPKGSSSDGKNRPVIKPGGGRGTK